MNRGAWWATVHGVTKSRTRLSVPFTFYHSTSKFIKLCDLAIKICIPQLQRLAKETRLLKPILLMGTKRKSGQILHLKNSAPKHWGENKSDDH